MRGASEAWFNPAPPPPFLVKRKAMEVEITIFLYVPEVLFRNNILSPLYSRLVHFCLTLCFAVIVLLYGKFREYEPESVTYARSACSVALCACKTTVNTLSTYTSIRQTPHL